MAVLSKKAKEELKELSGKGYEVTECRVRFVVAWWDKEDEMEYPILLPDITLKKIGSRVL